MKNLKTIKETSMFLFLLTTLFLFQSCACANSDNYIKGNGDVNSYIYEVSGYNSIEIRGMFTVLLTQGDTEEVFLDVDSNLHELISVEVVDNTLIISTRRERFIKPTRIGLHIKFKELEKLTCAGASKIKAANTINSQSITIDLSGATSIKMDLDVDELVTKATGASNILYSGNANSHYATMSGAGKLQADDFITQFTQISLSGAGSASVHANDQLKANVSGVGNINYAGNPGKKNVSSSGLGRIVEL